MVKAGTPFERLTQRVYQWILNAEGLGTVTVEHDVTLEGASGATHQVDVYWVFEHAGIRYETLVSCKDWSDPVPKREVSDLVGVLDDLRRPATGVVVSSSGFQEGAIKYAGGCGVRLCTLQEGQGEAAMEILLNLYHPHTSGFELLLDNEWNRSEARRRGIPEGTELNVQLRGMSDELYFMDADNAPVETLYEVSQRLVPPGRQETPRTRMVHEFPEDRFVDVPEPRMPRLKVLGVAADVEVRHTQSTIRAPVASFPVLILRDILEDTTRHLPADLMDEDDE